MNRLIALFLTLLWWIPPVFADWNGSSLPINGQNTTSPATTANPLPVTLSGSSGGAVTISSTVNPTGVALANFTNTTTNIPASATTVTLAAASTNVTVVNNPGGADIYLNFTGSAASVAGTSGLLKSGYSYTYTGVPAISTFSVIGVSASGNFTVFAH